jgi:uncharacterized protein YjgD (DUF1641 family)
VSNESQDQTLTPEEQAAANRILARIAKSSDSIEQTLDLLDELASSGNLAAITGVLADFNENFSAITRPDVMTMMANMMMLMGLLSQINYEPFFALAMKAPDALNDAYPRFQKRKEKLGLMEALELFRSPEVAGALEMMVGVMRSLKTDGGSPPRR